MFEFFSVVVFSQPAMLPFVGFLSVIEYLVKFGLDVFQVNST